MKDIVYKTSIEEIEKLNNLTVEELKNNPYLLKISKLKSEHVLNIIKQEEVDYKKEELELRKTIYELRSERNNVLKEQLKIQEQKLR